MIEATLSGNLQYLMKMHGNLSVSELARRTKIPQPTLHHILNKATKNPRKEALQALANFFAISVAQLVGTLPLQPIIPDSIKNSLKIMSVPILDWNLIKDRIQGDSTLPTTSEIIISSNASHNSFAVTMPDSSMEPMFPEQSILIFDPAKQSKDRDFVIVYSPDTNSYTFNRLFIEDDEYFIKQKQKDNQTHLAKLDLAKDKIMATLIEVRLQF